MTHFHLNAFSCVSEALEVYRAKAHLFRWWLLFVPPLPSQPDLALGRDGQRSRERMDRREMDEVLEMAHRFIRWTMEVICRNIINFIL